MKKCEHEQFMDDLFEFCYSKRHEFSPTQCVFHLLYTALSIAIYAQTENDFEKAIKVVDETYKDARDILIRNIEIDNGESDG